MPGHLEHKSGTFGGLNITLQSCSFSPAHSSHPEDAGRERHTKVLAPSYPHRTVLFTVGEDGGASCQVSSPQQKQTSKQMMT